MADLRAVLRHFPAVRDYARHRRWVRRGDVVAYAPGIVCDAFRTDGLGYRTSIYGDRPFSVADCLRSPSHVLMLGSSHVFGYGLASDEETLSSQLALRLGIPCGGIAFPEADTRTLFGVLANLLSKGARPLAVVLLTGGDLTRHAFSGIADPVFGSPNVEDARPVSAQESEQRGPTTIRAALEASALWTRATIDLVRAYGVPIVLGADRTFMDKAGSDPVEADCRLGLAGDRNRRGRFEHQRRHGPAFYDMRRQLATETGVTLAGPDPESLVYIDEYHYRAEGCMRFAAALRSHLPHP